VQAITGQTPRSTLVAATSAAAATTITSSARLRRYAGPYRVTSRALIWLPITSPRPFAPKARLKACGERP
jgi:hypothetical protein